jgi:hypothetical protein
MVDPVIGNDSQGARNGAPFLTASNAGKVMQNEDVLYFKSGTNFVKCVPNADYRYSPATVQFLNLTNIHITGAPGAIIYAPDMGYGWTFSNCYNVKIHGLTFYGSRSNENNVTYVYGLIGFTGPCAKFEFYNNTVKDFCDQIITEQGGGIDNVDSIHVHDLGP